MTTFEAIILGIIQGVTEFLPISSSGHLALGQLFFGFENLDRYLLFNVVCHVGTLCAILAVFMGEIKQLSKKQVIQVVIGSLPLFPMVLFLKPLKVIFAEPQYLGYFFLLTALLLQLGMSFGKNADLQQLEKRKWKDPFLIGLFQVLALFPGVSRSGSTISGARLMGWSRERAITFSFLLAIPAILGAVTIESVQIFKQGGILPDITAAQYIAGFSTAFGVGYGALLLLVRLALKGQFHYFVWYCLLVGSLTLIYFNF